MELMFKVMIKKMNIKENRVRVKELIKQLKEFDENMEVQFNYQDVQTFYIEGIKETTEDYKEGNEKIVVIY